MFHRIDVATPSFSLHSLTPQSRGTNVVAEPHVRRQQPAEEHAVDVQGPHPAVGEVRNRAQKLRPDEFGRDGQRNDADDRRSN